MDELDSNDLEYREERKESIQPVKKHIALKLKTTTKNTINSKNVNSTTSTQIPTSTTQFQFNSNNVVPATLPSLLNNNNDSINSDQFIQQHQQQQQELTLPQASNTLYNNQIMPNSKKMKLNNSIAQFNDVDDRSSTSSSDDLMQKSQNKSIVEKLNWNYNVNLIGKKVFDQNIYTCDICTLPMLIYGRIMPCKHVFCIKCAYENTEKCARVSCRSSVERIEEATHGQIFICTYNENSNTAQAPLSPSLKLSCGRSYMSLRDLNAHIKHRHDTAATNTNEQYLNSSTNPNRINNLITIMTAGHQNNDDTALHLYSNTFNNNNNNNNNNNQILN